LAERLVALGGLIAFVAIVVLQHLLVPELAPRRNTISEYANANVGWLMVAGFLAWALSLAATADLVRRDGHSVAHGLLVACIGAAALGMLVTACFPTQTIAGVLPAGVERSTAGRLHDLGSGAVMLALFAASVIALRAIAWPSWFRWWTVGLLALAVVGGGALLTGGQDFGGLRQRLLVTVGCAVQAALLRVLQVRSRSKAASSSLDATGPLRSMSR
jgi:hypothetical protein